MIKIRLMILFQGAGLYYLAEIVEEYASVAKKVINYTIVVGFFNNIPKNSCLFIIFNLLIFDSQDRHSSRVWFNHFRRSSSQDCYVVYHLQRVVLHLGPVVSDHTCFISSVCCFV